MKEHGASARPPIWDLLRWLLALPAAVMTYVLVTAILVQATTHLPLSGRASDLLAFSLGTLAGVSAGSWTAPGFRFRAACGLTALLALSLAYVMIGLSLTGTFDPAVLRVALGELAAALIVVYLFWRAERRASGEFR